MHPTQRSFARFAFLSALLACSGEELVEPQTGTLRVITSTQGTESDEAGYSVHLDTESPGRWGQTQGSR